MSAVTEASPRPGTDADPSTAGRPGGPLARTVLSLGIAGALVAVAFVTGGGVDETVATPGNTWTEIALTVVGAIALAAGLLARPDGERRFGWATAGLMGLLFALVASSIAWSVVPDSSWLAAGQMLAYLAVFTGAIFAARPLRRGWSVLLGALALWSVALSTWSLVVKVFPATLAASNTIGRLQAPFGYWNAIALCAAMGVPCCLWLGARRERGRRLGALAAPGLTVLVAVLVLSYSRSADLAAAVAVAVWLACVPLRLRAVAMLAVGGVGGAVVSAWALTHHAISSDNVPIAAQDHAGHPFGIVILVVLVLITLVGVAVNEAIDRTNVPESTRRRVGGGLLGLLGLLVLAAIGAVAASSRGLFGEISYRWHELTDPQAIVSASQASRVFQFGSSRPLYWREALDVGDHAVFKGVGALGYSVARLIDPASVETVFQAHGYVFETYADLGVLGLAVTAALLGGWLWASGRTLTARGREPGERAALMTLAALVLAFGVQGTLDWTWYFTGLGVPALLAAGWLVGCGPVTSGRATATADATARRSLLDRPARLAVLPLLLGVVLLGSWLVWRPLHGAQLVNQAENTGSLQTARAAHDADPFSLDADELLSGFWQSAHEPTVAQSVLVQATLQQPRNPYAWEALAQFLVQRREWRSAVGALHMVQILDRPQNALAAGNDRLIRTTFRHLPPGG